MINQQHSEMNLDGGSKQGGKRRVRVSNDEGGALWQVRTKALQERTEDGVTFLCAPFFLTRRR